MISAIGNGFLGLLGVFLIFPSGKALLDEFYDIITVDMAITLDPVVEFIFLGLPYFMIGTSIIGFFYMIHKAKQGGM